MGAGVFASRRFVVNLITAVCLVFVSCSDRDSPTSPALSSPAGKATISGTLLLASDSPAGGAGQPLANVTVRVASTGQTAQTDAAGNFTLGGVSPGAVALDIHGPGIRSSATVNASPGVTTKVTVTVNRGRSTVSLVGRSNHVEGVVDSIPTASSFVLRTSRGMVTIQTDSNTRFRLEDAGIAFGNLKVGQRVEVEGSLQQDGSILAARVKVENEEQEDETRTPTPTPTGTPATATPTRTPKPEEVELEGTVGTVTGTSFILMTQSGPVMIQTNGSTIFRKGEGPATLADIKTSERVEVHGARQGDGSVLASRVDIEEEAEEKTPTPTRTPTAATTSVTTATPTPTRTPEPEEGIEREGIVGSINGASFVLMTGSGPVMVQTNSATLFRRDGSPASFADIKVGGDVQAEGALQADGSLFASRVSIKGE